MAKKTQREPIVLSQMRPLTLLLVLCSCILFTFALIHFDSVLDFVKGVISALGPIIAGCIIAYLLNPMMSWLEKHFSPITSKLFKNHQKFAAQMARGCSSFIAVLLFLGTAALLVFVTFSQVADSVSKVIEKAPAYAEIIGRRFQIFLSKDSQIEEYLQQFMDKFLGSEMSVDPTESARKIVSALWSGASGTLTIIYSIVIGFIVAVYLLFSKERFLRQFKMILFALLKPKTATWINENFRFASNKFGKAILGKTVDSIIVGLLCFAFTKIAHIPYDALVAVIIGVTNMVPFFGPVIGAVPAVALVLMESPLKALYLLIFIVALQQFDMNILSPKIVGKSTGLPTFWELFACLLGGGLFGIWGLVLGVPMFAVLYTFLREIVADALRDKELPADFLKSEFGLESSETQSGLFDDEPDSDYIQHLILLEELSEQKEKSNQTKEVNP